MTEENVVTPENGLSLIIGPDDGTIDNADVRVRWCVTPELTAFLESQDVKNPYIVISTYTTAGDNEWRGLFPLNEIMSFARFYNAGKINITAFIVEVNADDSFRRGWNPLWTGKEYDKFNYEVHHYGKTFIKPQLNETKFRKVFAVATDTVVIPSGVFAKEPSAWVDWFANMWHGKNKTDDGCEFRTRKWLAFSVKWLPMLIWSLFYWAAGTLFALVMLATGFKVWFTSWEPLKNPFNPNLFGTMNSDQGEHRDLRDSSFIVWVKWPHNITQPIFSLLFCTPAVVLFLFGIAWITIGGDSLTRFYEAHHFTAYFVLFFTLLMAAYDACVAIMNVGGIVLGEETYREHTEQGKQGIGLLVCLMVAFLLIALMPWWLFATIVFIGVILAASAFTQTKKVRQLDSEFLLLIP